MFGEHGGFHQGHPRRDGKYGSLGITPDLGMLGVFFQEISGVERPLTLGPVPGSPSLGQAGNSWLRGTLSRVELFPAQREGCALVCSWTHVFGEGAMETGEFGELPTPTSQPLVSVVALGRVPKRRPEAKLSGPGVHRATGYDGYTTLSGVLV